MRTTGKQSSTPIKPSPDPATMPNGHETDQKHGEGSYSGTREYQASVKAYLETADVEKDARDAAPDSAEEARALEQAEEAGRKPAIKTERPSKN